MEPREAMYDDESQRQVRSVSLSNQVRSDTGTISALGASVFRPTVPCLVYKRAERPIFLSYALLIKYTLGLNLGDGLLLT